MIEKFSMGLDIAQSRYSEIDLPKTKRRSGTSGELGILYEKKLLMLVLYQALKNGLDFILDTNIEEAGAFDDVVFTYKEIDKIEKRIYLQTKHKENKNKKISYEDLLKSGNDDYALYKYFIGYYQSIAHFDARNKGESQYFIIYTNIDFNCNKSDEDGLRKLSKSENEYFLFKKVDSSMHKHLTLFSLHSEPQFYQFLNETKNGDNYERKRLIENLKIFFKEITAAKIKNLDPQSVSDCFKQILNNDVKFEAMISNYLNVLIFAIDQPNEEDLEIQMKSEIKQFRQSFLSDHQVNFIFEYALNEIGKWKKTSDATPLNEKNDFFKQGFNRLDSLQAVYPVLLYENELGASGIEFKLDAELTDFICSGKKMWSINSETPWLSSMVIYQALRDNKDYASHDNHLLLSWADLHAGFRAILPAFQAMDKGLLVVACLGRMETVELPEIAKKIVAIVLNSSENLKQIIIIAPETHKLLQYLKKKIKLCYDKELKIDFGKLSPLSQKTCLAVEKICFQGDYKMISLKQLLGLQETSPISEKVLTQLNRYISASALELFLMNSVVAIGNKESQLSHLESAYYKIYTKIKIERLQSMVRGNPENIFAFSGAREDILPIIGTSNLLQLFTNGESCLPGYRFFFFDRNYNREKLFEQLCEQVDKTTFRNQVQDNLQKSLCSKIHLIEKQGQNLMWIKSYTQGFYTSRCFFQIMLKNNKIKNLVLNSNPLDFFNFSGINQVSLLGLLNISDKYTSMFNEIVVVSPTPVEKSVMFQKVFMFSEKENTSEIGMHWVKVVDKKLYWLRSSGTVCRIRKAVINEKTIDEPSLIKTEERVIILADEPGMGKSTTLTRLSKLIKNDNPLSWVIKINLNQHQELLDSSIFNTEITQDKLIEVLSQIVSELKVPLACEIFQHQLTRPGLVVLLCDGFDEVKTERQEAVLRWFTFFKTKTAVKLWITTRRHDQSKLEESLSTLSYLFHPLRVSQQVDFLCRFWITTLKLIVDKSISSKTTKKLKVYAKEIIECFENSIHNQSNSFFISIPLRAHILAEVFRDRIHAALVAEELPNNLFKDKEKLGIASLYKQFIEKKYDNYFREKMAVNGRLDDETAEFLKRAYSKSYKLLAMKDLFDPTFVGNKKRNFSFDILVRIGLIQGRVDKVMFTHRTFSEYFAAKWLVGQVENKTTMKYWGQQLFKKKYQMVLNFFNHIILQDLPLQQVVLEGNFSKSEISLSCNNAFSENTMDCLGRTLLHIAAQEGHHKIANWFLKNNENNVHLDQWKRTSLHYAAGHGHEKIVKLLTEKWSDINLKNHILSTPLHYGEEIGYRIFLKSNCAGSNLIKLVDQLDYEGNSALYYAADNGHLNIACTLLLHGAETKFLSKEIKGKLLNFACTTTRGIREDVNYPLHPVVGLLSIQVPQAVLGLSDHYEYPRLLSYFFSHGHTKVIHSLLASIPNIERRKMLVSQQDIIPRYVGGHSNGDLACYKILQYFDSQHSKDVGIEVNEDQQEAFLNYASSLGYITSLRFLLRKINQESENFSGEFLEKYKSSILHCISEVQHLNNLSDSLKVFILFIKEEFGLTQLHLAAINKYIRSMDKYVGSECFSNLNVYDNMRVTPLIYAANYDNCKFIDFYFHKLKAQNIGQDEVYEIVQAKTENGDTCLSIILKKRFWDSVDIFLNHIKGLSFSNKQLFNMINCRDKSGQTLFSYLIATTFTDVNWEKTIQVTFHHIVNFNFTIEQIKNMLSLCKLKWISCISSGFLEEAIAFLDGINSFHLGEFQSEEFINAFNHEGNAPLHIAAAEDYCFKVIIKLLESGAIYNIQNRNKQTPMDVFKMNHKENLNEGLSLSENEKTYYLLYYIDKLFDLVTRNKAILVDKTLKKLKNKQWLNLKFIFNVRNSDKKTLIDMAASYLDMQNNLLEWYCEEIRTRFFSANYLENFMLDYEEPDLNLHYRYVPVYSFWP